MLIAPFGSVRFRDFFFADVVTSIGSSLTDLGFLIVYFTRDEWKSESIV